MDYRKILNLLALGRLFKEPEEPLDQVLTNSYVQQNAALRRQRADYPEVGYVPSCEPANRAPKYVLTVEGAIDPLRNDVFRRL